MMGEAGNMKFDGDHQRVCRTSRNMVYNYYDFGTNKTETRLVALLLHGHGDLSFGWRSTVPGFLAAGVRCIVPDLLGFGSSSKPVDTPAYRLCLMAADMLELLADAHVTASAQVECSKQPCENDASDSATC